MYACDPHWWDLYVNELKRDFAGELWTQDAKSAKRYGLHHIPGVSLPGLGLKELHFGNNSGYQAVNLAYLFGATKIILLGFDMKTDAGKIHFFGQHPYHKVGQGPDNNVMSRWCRNFVELAADLKAQGVEVYNATRSTALTAFPIKQLEELESC
jgi:hypothetical protein